LPQLVDEDDRAARFTHIARNFSQGLAHQARLQTNVRITHFTFNFGAGH